MRTSRHTDATKDYFPFHPQVHDDTGDNFYFNEMFSRRTVIVVVVQSIKGYFYGFGMLGHNCVHELAPSLR